MRLNYSTTGIPFIEIDEETRIIFTKLTSGDKYFKWLTVRALEILNGETGKGKRRYMFTTTTRVSFITDFKLREFPRGLTKKHPSLTKVKHALLKKIFSDLCVEDKEDSDILLFPEDKLSDLEYELDKRYNDEDDE